MSNLSRPRDETPIRSVFDRLRAKRESALPTRIPRLARDGGAYPLSDGQERLWFIDRMLPGNAAYNIAAAVEMAGSLDLAAFAAALIEIVRRHETLRTNFPAVGDQPVQVISPVAGSPLHQVDLGGLADGRRIADRLAGGLAAAPFDLVDGALLRVGLLRLGAEEHRLVLVLHHIVSDGWSLRILLRETRLLYQAFLKRRPSPLPELAVQYVDFVDWQRHWLTGDAAARQLADWKRELGERPPVLQLPVDRPRPAVQSLRGRSLPLILPLGLSAEISALTRSAEVTPFITLLAAFQALLHRLSGQPDILVGFPIANRKRPEIQDLIGFFVNTLVLRARFSAGLRFRDLLRSTHEAALGAHANQELPFGRLVKELQPARQTSYSPLVQVAFAYQNLEAASWNLPGLRLTPRDVPRASAMFDLQLDLKEEPLGFAGEIEYSTDLFDTATVSRWAGYLATLLAAVVADPERRVADLPLMSAAEAQQLYEANDTAVRFAAGARCLHELIAEQAACTPDAIAVVAEEGALSYHELTARSARLARQLALLGVGPDVRVGICLERSLELMAGLLAVLMAGGTYVPFDPSYPRERLAYMLADSAVPVLLSQPATRSALPDLKATGVHVVLLDGAPAACAGPGTVGAPTVHPENLAYVIYTSGSTGRPKGVMNTHAGIVNRLLWMQAQYGLTPDDRVLQKTPVSFDVSVWELFWPLSTGACLVMARPGGHQDGAYLVRTIAEREITTLHFVPSMLAVFLETPGVECCSAVLERAVVSGEALSPALAERYFSRLRAPLHNLYGPTEAAVDVTFWPCDPADRRGLVPIGRPVANTAIHLLDRDLHPVPLGVTGELHIGGVQVARGYLGRPDLTAERFVPDPSGDGVRLYATGDLARRLPEGEIDYLGRLDHQVKIRGFRIELGEIETVLGRHPEVGEAVIVAEPGRPGESARLVAYVVPDSQRAPTIRALLVRERTVADEVGSRPELERWIAGLRHRLREELPEYMVPAAFVALGVLPLTPSGKVDRHSLPAPDRGTREERALVPPRNPTEEILIAIWTAVLGIERCGVEDDFFALGGHSLLANQVVSRIRGSLGIELPLHIFFAFPTVAALAERVEAARRSGVAAAPPPLIAGEWRGDEPLSFAQQRLWFLNQLNRESTAYHVAVALRLNGALSPSALAASLGFVVERHETLRTTFALRLDGPVQVVAPPSGWRLPVVDVARLGEAGREAEMHRLAQAEANRTFDLARGPLLRTLLIGLAEREHVFSLVMHHIVSDGWSMGILWQESMALYHAAVARKPQWLPPLPIQYRDFAAWQREWLSGETLERETDFWRRQLADAPTLLELPTDRVRSPVQRFRGRRLPFALPATQTAGFKQLGQRAGATLFMAILATFDVLLYRYSRQNDLIVGFPIAGRNRLEAEGLIGLFVNTLALRVQVEGGAGWLALLRRVRDVTLDAFAHQDLPFEKLVSELDLERNLSHAPLFQTLLVFQNTPAAVAELPGLAIQPLDVETGTAKFDLVLNLGETASGLAGWLIYNRDLFDPATVARMRTHLLELVTNLLATPERRVDELALLGPAERQQLLTAWNDTAAPGSETTFMARFTAQAARTYDSIALACGDLQTSYGELDLQSTRLARGLAARSVGPESQVAVLTERGIDLLAAMLALWKVGAVYLPLDPHHPAARLEQTLAQSGSHLVLAAEPLRAVATAERPAATIDDLLEDGRTAGILPGLPAPPGPAGLAYILFTSGSTGVPKGAMIEHRGMANHLAAKIADLGLTASDRVAQTALQTFDISIWQFLAALLVGASVDVLPDEVVRDPLSLLSEIERRGLTVFETVPSLLAALLQVEPDRRPDLAALRWAIPTGEALSPELCRQWFAAYPAIPLVNAYGPTECSDDVTHQVLRRPPPADAARIPIGRPVANTRVYVLGPGEEPAPIGVPGELAVAGVQVGRGYWGRPDLTADRFIPDPISALPGGRLYRTGDLARLSLAGEVEFLGRIDHQVKIRGFRIELGDIETALAAHPAVREAVVLARADRDEQGGAVDRRLVAYLVAEEGADLALPELRESLLRRLPEYMVPSAFVMLKTLPLTANGKLDRKALPAPEAGGFAASREFVAPRTDLERHLAGLWAESLGLAATEVGGDDSYFELGGNSILGAVLVNRLQKTLGEIVHVVALFDHPTVATMASYLARDYPAAVTLWGGTAEIQSAASARIDWEAVAAFRALLPSLGPAEPPAERNPSAVFLLSAPRSGSTLLRIMLGGHPGLFAPPELELLSFNTMAERRVAFSGRNSFWLEGLIRAVMEIHHSSPEEARALVERDEARALPTRLVYRRLQEWIGERTLVDKTPSYALGQDVLARAETDFAAPRYLHLMRHPNAAIRSFEEAKLDQVFFRHTHPFSRRQLAELIWVVSHQNVVQFLRSVPAERQHWIRFEELVRDPETALGKICEFLGLPLHPDMLQPYKDVNARMADGIHAQSRMLGDVKFLQHEKVEAKVGERWREKTPSTPLGVPTRELAAAFAYELPPEEDLRRPAAPAAPPLVSRARSAEEPLSFAQLRLWFLHQLDPESTAYHISAALHLEGAFDSAVLSWALGQVAKRQEMLRTTFHLHPDGPVQVIAPPAPWPLPVLDLSGLDEGTRQAEMRRWTAAEIDRRFDLGRGSLLRTTLFRLADREHVLLLVLHHVISDAWSTAILARETLAFYRAAIAGRPAGLPELPIQYGDYAAWQREWLSGATLKNELAYWREQLAGAPALLELPTDRPRPAVQRFHGGRVRFALPAEDSRSLMQLGHRVGATLFMTLLAAFDTLLYRYSQQEDVVVGFPIAGRNRVETEGLIGLFINTLALRVQVDPEASWRDLLAQVREVTLAAYLHQELPFEKLVAELDLERNPAHAPLFQTLFVLQNTPTATVEVPDLAIRQLDVFTGTAKFDLVLSLTETAEGIEGWLLYDRDLFDAATMTRTREHLQTLLAGIVAAPEHRVSELPLLTAAEQQTLRSVNDTAARYAHGEFCLHELIAGQAARTPDAIAVISEQGALSYQEFVAKARGLAGYLRTLGVGPETLVGVCLERSLDMMIGLLAVLEAGAAYVPLDPTYPAERLAWMLEDSAISVLLTQSSLKAALPEPPAGTRVVCLAGEIPTAPAFRIPVDPGHLAYVIYTSGSTGRPKGVMSTHRGIVNQMSWCVGTFLNASDVVLQKTPFSFDASLWELFGPLLCGARLYLAGQARHGDPGYLARTCRDAGVTVLQLVPSLLQVLLEEPLLAECRSIRRLFCGGEALSRELVLRAQSVLEAEVINLYGPTEAAVNVLRFTAERPLRRRTIPLGRPVANTEIHLLDRHLQRVPIGVAGELFIGGVQVARGYLGRPGLTADRFRPDPEGFGARLYATGDLARRLPSGEVDYLGRIDHQVKVRGFRIELGEIESVLAQLPGVREAVVLAREGPEGDRRLAAWIVAGEEPLVSDDLRQWLRSRLPEYMVPGEFSFLDSLPLTPNGKVDRRALPALDPSVRTRRVLAVAPRDVVEHRLVEIWAEILGLESVSLDESFFDLGGHSLSAVRLMARIEDRFGQALPLSAVFQAATVERMASLLRTGVPAITSTRSIVVKLQGGSRRPFFCVHPIGGNVFCYVLLARALGPEQPFYGLQVPDLSSAPAETLDTIEGMSRRYIEAMRGVQPTGPYRLGGWSMGGVVAFEIARQLRRANEEVEFVAMLDAPAPGDHRRAGDLDRSSILAGFARDLTGALLPVPVEEFRQLDHERQLAHLLTWAKETGALPASESLDRLAGLFAMFERNLAALGRYEPGPYPGRIDLFRASDTAARNPDPGWTDLAHGGVAIHEVPGDHYSIVRRPEFLAGRLKIFLER